jgi:four helix bundle protein
MIIRTLDELAVYQKALIAADAVSAIIDRPSFEKDRKLKEQLGASSSQVPALIAEGFEQKTDRHFAHYLYLARGSAKETKTHLIVAVKRRHLSRMECDGLGRDYNQIAKMSSGLIQHLEREDRKHRQPRRNRTHPPESPD